jgi:hypothetical protein
MDDRLHEDHEYRPDKERFGSAKHFRSVWSTQVTAGTITLESEEHVKHKRLTELSSRGRL